MSQERRGKAEEGGHEPACASQAPSSTAFSDVRQSDLGELLPVCHSCMFLKYFTLSLRTVGDAWYPRSLSAGYGSLTLNATMVAPLNIAAEDVLPTNERCEKRRLHQTLFKRHCLNERGPADISFGCRRRWRHCGHFFGLFAAFVRVTLHGLATLDALAWAYTCRAGVMPHSGLNDVFFS